MPDTKKNQILQSARKCFAKVGLAKTTLDDIAVNLGMKKSSLYYYYKSKEDILSDFINTESENLKAVLEEEMSKAGNAKNKLKSFVSTRIQYFNEQIDLYNVPTQVILEFKPILEGCFNEFRKSQLDILEEIIKEGVAKNEFIVTSPVQTANLILTVLEAVKFQELFYVQNIETKPVNKITDTKQTEKIIDLIINGIAKH
ncbi:MAG: TetR/AcrR family transcriptional regulator [Calditrichaeota bacterium]|nr:MAG: TetR/AcrR family transcriptional regulator [Calditrichota bacterium]MBL1208010.1 TetR/AcrR family transcriptional regulator [Calditrichota bacterium]NOG47846.1 TetR/AcrR family transcriptional regulator [Calditrichota bacterium]